MKYRLFAGLCSSVLLVVPSSATITLDESALRGRDPPPSFSSLFNTLFTNILPLLTEEIGSVLPASYGACNEGAPAPCIEGGELYNVHKSWEYKAIARYISGLNTLQLNGLNFSGEPQNFVNIKVTGMFASLPASIYIGECFTFDKCSILWDNTNGCCGSNKHFQLSIKMACDAAGGNSGGDYFSMISVESVDMDKIELTESIGPIHLDIQELTGTFKGTIEKLLTSALTAPPFIPWPPQNGSQKYDVLGLFNYFATSLAQGEPVLCS